MFQVEALWIGRNLLSLVIERAACKTGWTLAVAALAVSCGGAHPLSAQWVNYPTAGVPGTADGKPDLSAPAPRAADGKPDLSGLWLAANPLPCDGINRVCT